MGNLATGDGQPTATGVAPTPDGQPQADAAPSTDQQPQPSTSWVDSLPDDLKSSESIKKFKDVGALAKSYVELERFKFPDERSSADEWNKFYARVGRPEKPEGYSIERPEALQPGVEWNDELANSFKAVAHKTGLNNTQAKALVDFWGQAVNKQAEGFWTEERGLAALEQQITDEPKRNETLALTQRAVKELNDPEFTEWLDKSGSGNNPIVIRNLARVGKLFNEAGLPNADHGSGSTSVVEAKSEIARIKNDPKHPYHSGDAEATSYVNKLYEIVHGRKVLLTVG